MKKSFKTLALMIFVILSAAFIAVSTSAAPLPGDVNGDGEVNIRDAATILQFVTGHDVELVAPCTHSGYVVIDPAVDPTYDKSGLTIGVSCTKCGEKLIEQETVPALGHEHTEAVLPAVPATCQEEGLTEGKYCPECNTVLVKQKSTPKVDHELGDWEAYGSYTVRRCIKSEDCDVSIRVTSISATYNGSRLLTGEQVWKNDVTVTITLSDNTSFTAKSSQFTLENDVMTVDGNNVVTVKFVNTVTTVTVPAIHDNLPGTAPASDFEYSGVDKDAITITKYIGTSTEVVIPAHINRVPVRYIGDSAFSGNKVIQSVTIPGSIKTIGQSAFYNCTGLKTLNLNEGLNTIKGQAFMNCPISTLVIPDSVNAIDCYHYKVNTTSEAHHGAFEGCTYLTEVIIGDGLTTIRQDTFRGCISLKDLVIGDGVETIELYAFENCSSLETLNLGIAVQSIGNQAFRNCIMLREINFTDSVKFIGEYAFERCSSLVSVNIPGSVQTISWGAFLDCSGLKNLKLNEGLITIQGRAFMNCPITSVVIPDSVLTIECLHLNVNTTKEAHHGAFEGCQFLTEVIIGNGLKTISRETFKDCSSLKTLVIGDSVTIIELYAFENCSSLEILNIGSSVQSIGNQAFRNCTTLSEINFSSSVKTIGDYSFEKCSSLASVSIPGNVQTIGNGAFWGCSGLKSVNLNEGLITIQGRAFMNCPITSVVIPDSVLTIECLHLNVNTTKEAHHGAFEGCQFLTEVIIGNGLKTISRETFKDCSSLKTLVIGDSVTIIELYAFENCSSLEILNIGSSVQSIGNQAFRNCTTLSEINFSSSVKTIGDYSFEKCSSLASVSIPGNVQTIGNGAFWGCSGLKSVNLNEGLITIQGRAFMNCPITKIVIPNSVLTINCLDLNLNTTNEAHHGAFEGCNSLTKLVIGNGLTKISRETFAGCSALTDITIGSSVQTISDYAFSNCTALQTINIPDNVINIGPSAFKGCTLLENFRLGTGVQSIGASALQDCTSIDTVTIPANVQVIGNNAFTGCVELDETVIEKGALQSIGSNVYSGCSSFDRIYYTGNASDWSRISVNSKNVYPLTVTPYYYTAKEPSAEGNYWYYNSNGEKRVWNVGLTSFKAEEYSETFAGSAFGSETSSYASQLLKELKKDTLFQAELKIWEGVNLLSDFETRSISQKDLYKLLIYDLLMGEANSSANPYDVCAEYCDSFFIKILDSGFKYAKPSLEILKITDPSEYNYVIILNEFFEGVGNAELMFKTAGNMYDAIMAASQYLALSNMNENFRLVLNEIAKDSSLPKALRDAASECADAYNNASQELLEKISLCEYTKDTAIDIFKTFGTEALSRMIIEAFPNYIILDTVLSGMKFIMDNGFNCGDTSEKYYYLEASVGLENSLRKVIKNTLPDYYRYNLTDQSEYYMYSIDMYETSVLLGFDYASDLLTEFSKGIDVSDEEEEVYLNTVSQLAQMKENKKKNYDLFDDKIDDLFVEYYANYN